MVEREAYRHIKTEVGVSPAKFDIALTSIDSYGMLGKLNSNVLKVLGYDKTEIDESDLTKGFYLLDNKRNIPLLFIVTVEDDEFSGMTLQRNLREALSEYEKFLTSKNVWVPLMGTGSGELEYIDSYDTTVGVLKSYPNINFTIAIPDSKRGNDFINQFGTVNNEKNESSSNIENIESLNLLQLIRDVLNKVYSLNLIIQESNSTFRTKNKIDLYDKTNTTYGSFLKVNFQVYKSKFLDERQDVEYDSESTMKEVFSNITSDLESLLAENKVSKYFYIFDKSFLYSDLKNIKQWAAGLNSDFKLIIFGINDIFNLANENNIDLSNYNLESEKNDNNKKYSDKIPFHLDQVVDDDKLGREPVAQAFVRLIKKDIFTEKLNHSFMVHLQGKWGSGKSSFLNFIKKNLNTDGEEWIVVEYNAWQNQHIAPPWWTFIDQIYLRSRKILNNWASFHLWRKETQRRIFLYSGVQKLITTLLFIASFLLLFYFGGDIFSFNENDNKWYDTLGDIVKIILTVGTLTGTLYSFSKSVTTPFFINSSKDAESFVLKANDPMNQVKKHFNSLVDNINNKEKKRQLAIFIDDIDRCNKEFIVELLEGIQTLFKEKRVLYIIAGDKNWISTSFANTYEEFSPSGENKRQLGEFFIQKAFQLSIRLPNISNEYKQEYWNYILGIDNKSELDEIGSIEELTDSEQSEIKSDLEKSKSELTNPEFVKTLQEKYNLKSDAASNLVIEEKNKDSEDFKHLLQEYHSYIDTNPRSIIRLANNYTMARSTLMAERVTFNEHILFRWLVIEDLCPQVKYILNTIEDLKDIEAVFSDIDNIIKRKNCMKLLKGEEEFMEGEITIEDIKTIKGL